MFQDPEKKSESRGLKPKSSVTCFESNGKGYYKMECLELKNQKEKHIKKKKKDALVAKATWDDMPSSNSSDEEELCQVI